MKKILPRLIRFYTGRTIPQIGFGTYLLQGQSGIKAIKTALDYGYRHIDTASMYENGIYVREAILQSGIPREQIFITSKIDPGEQGYKSTIQATERILNDLGTKYVDLMLVHWPGVDGVSPSSTENARIRLQTYKALEDLQAQNKIRDIGVSNFLPRHLNHLLQNCRVKPVLNQFEIHPLGWDRPTVELCRKNDIIVQSYSPLAKSNPRLLRNPYLLQLAEKYTKSSAQIALRWGIQMGFVTVPKSKTEKYIKQNFDILDFELTEDEMRRINEMNQNERITWNPEIIEH